MRDTSEPGPSETQAREMLKLNGIKCESRKSARELFAYGGTEPLPTLGTFTADVMLTENNTHCRADFMVAKGNGRTLIGRETACPGSPYLGVSLLIKVVGKVKTREGGL